MSVSELCPPTISEVPFEAGYLPAAVDRAVVLFEEGGHKDAVVEAVQETIVDPIPTAGVGDPDELRGIIADADKVGLPAADILKIVDEAQKAQVAGWLAITAAYEAAKVSRNS